MWSPDLEQGNEAQKIKYDVVEYTRGAVLDIGCGPYKAFPHFIGIDNWKDLIEKGIHFRPDLVMNADRMPIIASECMDAIFSSHLLEHIEDYKTALKEWWRVLRHDGYLILYLPHKNLYPNIGHWGANEDHKHDFLPEDIIEAMRGIGSWDLLRNEERSKRDEYSFLQVYKKLRGKRHHFSWEKPKPEKKTVGVVRYGAIGDMMQLSSVLKGLKDQDYYVYLHTTPRNAEILKHDPHVDEFVLQDTDQVPNQDLGPFFAVISERYDKFINLCESEEASLLAMPNRTPFNWAPAARHTLCNRNYLDVQHDMAGVARKLQMRHYTSPEERKWAKEFREKTKAEFLVLWALAGSGVHKTWPYVDAVVAALMLHHPGIHVVFVGDDFCRILEGGWENEKRVHKKSGQLTVRETLSLIEVADCIIGPETGVLNAAACMEVPKVLFLSHSTHENLSRDWTNVYPLSAESVTCAGRGKNEAPACHQLHYSWAHCTKDYDENCKECKAGTCTKHTSTAVCQSAITPDRVLNVVYDLVDKKLNDKKVVWLKSA